LPTSPADKEILSAIYTYFEEPTDFEACAAQLWMMMAPNAAIERVTRASRDGGRDALGTYQLGPVEDPIGLRFSLEAKCYGPSHGVTVKDLARLISRLRHREFGVLVTTSYLGRQAYEELREDGHPIVVICGADIVRLLRQRGFDSADAVRAWLESSFPKST